MSSSAKITLNQLFIRIVAVGVVTLLLTGFLLVHQEQQKTIKQWQADVITRSTSLTTSYYVGLVTKLVLERNKEVARFLSELKEQEGLSSISVVPENKLDPKIIETCKIDYNRAYFLQVPTCYEMTNQILTVYHELRSIGYSIGYLAKKIKIPPYAPWHKTHFVTHVVVVLLVFLGMFFFILSYIKKHLIRPLKNIGERLDRQHNLTGKLIDIDVLELQSIFDSLKKSIATTIEFEQKAQRYEYEAKIGQTALQVAHDIRSPLSAMQAALGMVREGRKMEDAMNLLELSAKRLTGIADDLLKKHKGVKEENLLFNLHKILDELVGEYQDREEFSGLKFFKEYSSQAIQLAGDRSKLQRAFGNIIKNAVEAMEGRGTITLRTGVEQGEVVVHIADTGPGIFSDKLEKILQGGFTEGKEDGHGIGMKVVQDTVTEFGGKLSAGSEIGKGTTFTLTFPIPSEAIKGKTSKERDVVERFTITVFPNELVLIIDDESSLREQWRLTLQDPGVILCESFEDFERKKITPATTLTAIVDYHYNNSEMDGIEILRRLKDQGFQNLYLCTAEYWKPSIQKQAGELGVGVIPKPLPKVVICHPETKSKDPASTVPLRDSLPLAQHDKEGYHVLVIDDDPLIGITWKTLQQQMKIGELHLYTNLESLQGNKEKVDMSSIDFAFLDKNIEESKYSFYETADYLKSNRVKKIILATGESFDPKSTFPSPSIDHISKNKIPETLEAFL